MRGSRRKLASEARCKLAENRQRCQLGCRGWHVFDTGSGLEVDACDACQNLWTGRDHLRGFEVAALPEARAELRRSVGATGIPMSKRQAQELRRSR